MHQATSAEFQREFGRFRAIAQREPVTVTNHGRADIVVVSAQEFQRLMQRDRKAMLSADLSDAELKLLDEQVIPDEAHAFDHEVE